MAQLSRAELRENFDYNDSNHDGRIDFAEFVALLEALEAGMSTCIVKPALLAIA